MPLPSSFANRILELFDEPEHAEKVRREIYAALSERVASLKSLRDKLTKSGIPTTEVTHTDRQIALYNGPDGMLVRFMAEEDEEAFAKKTGLDPTQLDIEAAITKETLTPLIGKVEDLHERLTGERASVFDIAASAEDDGTPPSADQIDRTAKLVFDGGPADVSATELRQALSRRTSKECDIIAGFYLYISSRERADPEFKKAGAVPPAIVSALLCDVSGGYAMIYASRDATARGDLVGAPQEAIDALREKGDPRVALLDEANAETDAREKSKRRNRKVPIPADVDGTVGPYRKVGEEPVASLTKIAETGA